VEWNESIIVRIKQTVVIIEANDFCQLRKKFYPTSSGMQRKLLGIINFDAKYQLLVVYSAFFKY
jgi:hypothetical protein